MVYTSVDRERVKVKLLKRDADANYAVLRFTHAEVRERPCKALRQRQDAARPEIG